jgi:hypothetical protein
MAEFTSIKKYLDDLVKIHIVQIKDTLLKDRELIDWCTEQVYDIMNTTLPDINTDSDSFKNKPFAYTGINHNVSFGTVDASTTTITGTLTVSGMIYGTAQHALYSDLAECYSSKVLYNPGTIVSVSDSEDPDHEVDPTDISNIHKVVGVVSTDPAFVMNSDLKEQNGKYNIPIGLIGRIPTLINGPIKKGQYVTIDPVNPGVGKFSMTHTNMIGIALESKSTDEIGLVLCKI